MIIAPENKLITHDPLSLPGCLKFCRIIKTQKKQQSAYIVFQNATNRCTAQQYRCRSCEGAPPRFSRVCFVRRRYYSGGFVAWRCVTYVICLEYSSIYRSHSFILIFTSYMMISIHQTLRSVRDHTQCSPETYVCVVYSTQPP